MDVAQVAALRPAAGVDRARRGQGGHPSPLRAGGRPRRAEPRPAAGCGGPDVPRVGDSDRDSARSRRARRARDGHGAVTRSTRPRPAVRRADPRARLIPAARASWARTSSVTSSWTIHRRTPTGPPLSGGRCRPRGPRRTSAIRRSRRETGSARPPTTRRRAVGANRRTHRRDRRAPRQPLTPPTVMPSTKNRWAKRKMTTTGSTTSVAAAISRLYATSCWLV